MSKTEQKTVPEILEGMRNTAIDREGKYGQCYNTFGDVAMALWPGGLKLETREQFIRHGVVVQILNKLTRYTSTKEGHADSAHDMAVYAAILEKVTDDPLDF